MHLSWLIEIQLAYGTGTAWYKSGDESKLDQACIDSTKTAIGLGYYHLDGAEVYKTEAELGMAISQSGVSREKLYVVTKVISNIADIPSAFNASLKKLGLDYIDLYLIHAPFFSDKKEEHQAKWKQMEELKKQGLAKSIGVSNYLPEHLEWILESCSIPPAINQIEFHPYLQHKDLLKFHKEKVRSFTPSVWVELTWAGHRHISIRPTLSSHKSSSRSCRRDHAIAREEICRESRRNQFALVHRPGHCCNHHFQQRAAFERLPPSDDV